MQPHLLEEAHELIHAVSIGDLENFKEELADLLFLVVFFARLAEEQGWFDLYDAAAAGVEKLIFRHPHVFGDLEVSGADQVLKNWERLKEKEKARSRDLDGATIGPESTAEQSKNPDDVDDRNLIPTRNDRSPSEFGKNTAYLPGLHRAEKLQKKAALKGFDWTNIRDVRAKLDEELAELDELLAQLPQYQSETANPGARTTSKSGFDETAKSPAAPTISGDPVESGEYSDPGSEEQKKQLQAALTDELGDVLFCVVNLARHLHVPAELSIHETCEKFIRRFREMEDMSSSDLEDLDLDELESLYQKAKAKLSNVS